MFPENTNQFVSTNCLNPFGNWLEVFFLSPSANNVCLGRITILVIPVLTVEKIIAIKVTTNIVGHVRHVVNMNILLVFKIFENLINSRSFFSG